MTAAFNFRRLGLNPSTRELAAVVNRMQLGGTNNTGTVTLTASTTTTRARAIHLPAPPPVLTGGGGWYGV